MNVGIGPADKLVFIHIGKTAGTSVRQVLKSQFAMGEVCPAEHFFQFEALSPSEKERYKLFQGHLGWNQAKSLGTRWMTFLRNPTDRYLSLYFYWRWLDRDSPEHALPKGDVRREWGLGVAKDHSLEEFVELDDPRIQADTVNTQVWQLALDQGPARKTHAGIGEDELLKLATDHMNALDFVGIVEDMPRSMALLDRTFGWKLPRQAPHYNKTPGRPSAKDLPMAIKRKIYARTELDWELYSCAVKRFLEVAGSGIAPL